MYSIRALSPVLAKKAKEELNEDSDRLKSDLDSIHQWISKQAHLRIRTDSQFLVAFLRGCKHSLERTKEKLDSYYTLRQSLPELFKDRNATDDRIRSILKLGVVLRLPETASEDGPRVTIIRNGAYNPDEYKFHELVRVGTFMGDIAFMEDDNAVVAGQIDILDMADVTMEHFSQMDFAFLKKLVVFSEKASPIRQKGIHFINTPPGFEPIFNTVKNFMSEKKKQRIIVHGSNLQSLYQYVPQHILPKEYGGSSGTIEDSVHYWEKKFSEYSNYFIEDNTFGTDEKLRVGKSFNPESVFGIDGSFRSLNVD